MSTVQRLAVTKHRIRPHFESLENRQMLTGASVGDFNCDGRVTFDDFLILSSNFGSSGSEIIPENGDANGDQAINFADFLILSSNFGETYNKIFDIEFEPLSPAYLAHDDRIDLNFSYTTNHAGGVRIWAEPMTGGVPSPGGAFAPSALEPAPGGDSSRFITITNGDINIDQVRLQMWTDGQTELLYETIADVHYDYSEVPGLASENPVLVFQDAEDSAEFTTYSFTVSNREAFPDEMFAPAPHLPPCGLNPDSSRTWVDFQEVGGGHVYGFCAFSGAEGLDEISFATAKTEAAPPDAVKLNIQDRELGINYNSNNIFLGYESLARDGIAALSLGLSGDEIDSSDGARFTPGTYFVYKTNEGRFGKFMIKNYAAERNNELMIDWVTYDDDGSIHASGTNLTVRGTFTVDLDNGTEEGTAPIDRDFFWEQKTPSSRALTPQGTAVFEMIHKPNLLLPDLVVADLGTPLEANIGELIGNQIQLVVRNDGNAVAAGGSSIGIYLSADSTITTDDQLLLGGREFLTDSINPGGVANITVASVAAIPVGASAGPQFIGVVLDEADVVTESNEANNTFVNRINISPAPRLPDIEVVSITAPSEAILGSIVGPEVKFEVRNNGASIPAGTDFSYGVYLSDDRAIDASDRLLLGGREFFEGGLATGEARAFNFPVAEVQVDAKLGSQFVGVWIDEADAITEFNETNNTAATAIDILFELIILPPI